MANYGALKGIYQKRATNPRRGQRIIRTMWTAPFFIFLENLMVPGHNRTLFGKTSGRGRNYKAVSRRKESVLISRGLRCSIFYIRRR